jgi:hypothetical protein
MRKIIFSFFISAVVVGHWARGKYFLTSQQSERDLRVTATNRDLCKHAVTNKAGHRHYVKWRRNRRPVSGSFNLLADGKMTV